MFDSISRDTLAAVLLIVLVFQLKRILVIFNLAKMRMRASEWKPVLRSRVPESTLQLLESAEPGLAALGFELVGTQAYEPFNVFDPCTHKFDDFYWHPEKSILAIVALAEPLSGQVTKVQFVSMFSDGTALETVNRQQWALLPVPDKITVGDAYAVDLDGQWQFHLQALAREQTAHGAVSDKLTVMQRLGDIGVPAWIAQMQQVGWAEKCDEATGLYRFTPRGAWAYSGQLKRQPREARKALARPYRHMPVPDVTATRIAEMNHVAANLELAAQPLPGWVKGALFGVTLLLSILAFGSDFTPTAAVAVTLVMLVHELGHFAAMKAFGYRNLSVFFLPFFGAAATGHKPHASPWQEAVVLLAGPVPGIVLALAATQIPSDALPQLGVDFMREFVWFALRINLFNLLPIGVLDGGKLFELAVLGRFPRARAVFAMLGAAAGMAWAVSQGSWGLGVAMIFVLWWTPLQFKAARVIRGVRAAAKARGAGRLGKEEVIAALAQEFARGDYGGTSGKGWTQRLNIATLAYPRLLQGVPRVSMSVVVPAVQGLAFFAPMVLLAVWSLQQPARQPLMRTTVAEQREIDQRVAQERNDPKVKAAQAKFMARYAAEADPKAKWAMLARDDDDEDTAVELDEAWVEAEQTALLPQLPQDHAGKLRYLLGKVDSAKPGAADAILGVIGGLTRGGARKAKDLGKEQFAVLMNAYAHLARVATPDVLAVQMPILDEIWLGLNAPGSSMAGYKPRLASIRARMAFAVGRQEDAQIWMDRYVASSDPKNAYAARQRGWFLLDIGHYDEALALAQRAIEADKTKSKGRPNMDWQALAGWAEMGRGQAREADKYFQAALDEQAARLKESSDGLSLWQRLITKAAEAKSPASRASPQMLDHLAALEGYDPAGATRLRAELIQGTTLEQMKLATTFSFSMFDGWGKAREAGHHRMLDTLYPVRNVAAAGS